MNRIKLTVGMLLLGAFTLSAPFVGTSYAASATTYYVSPSGNDKSNGTSTATPWKTLAKVNASSLQAGDKVLLKGGSSFSGQIYLSPSDLGTAASPITISSYGTGQATISASTDAIYGSNVGNFTISNLKLVGAKGNTGNGINLYNSLANNTSVSGITIDSVDAGSFAKYGMVFGGGNGLSGYSGVSVTNSNFHDNILGGLSSYGPTFDPSSDNYVNSNVYVGNVKAYNNSGDSSNKTSNTGNGIVLGSVNGATIEKSVAYNNGYLCAATTEGPAGIWTYNANNVTMQYDEVYTTHTASSNDGDGFDLDINVTNSTLQYNYAHSNDGPGYLIWGGSANQVNPSLQTQYGNTVRYDISQNDGYKNNTGGIAIGGAISGAAIYDNTVYNAAASGKTTTALDAYSTGSPQNVTVRNNIFSVTGNNPVLSISASAIPGLTFQGNDYYTTGTFKLVWGATSYCSLAAWRTASGQETLNAAATGRQINPKLTSPGSGGTYNNSALLTGMTAYKLLSGSPMIDTGLTLSQFGTTVGSRDFYGNSLPQGTAYDIGANEFAK